MSHLVFGRRLGEGFKVAETHCFVDSIEDHQATIDVSGTKFTRQYLDSFELNGLRIQPLPCSAAAIKISFTGPAEIPVIRTNARARTRKGK